MEWNRDAISLLLANEFLRWANHLNLSVASIRSAQFAEINKVFFHSASSIYLQFAVSFKTFFMPHNLTEATMTNCLTLATKNFCDATKDKLKFRFNRKSFILFNVIARSRRLDWCKCETKVFNLAHFFVEYHLALVSIYSNFFFLYELLKCAIPASEKNLY